MLLVPSGTNTFGSSVKSWGTTRPGAAFGVVVSPSIGSKGAWTQLFAATSSPSYGILVCINSNNTSAACRATVVDIGVDPAGGTSYTTVIADLQGGNAVGYTTGSGGLYYYFPLYIPAGATIGVRANSTVSTSFNVNATLAQKPTRPALVRQAAYVDTFGISGNAGTAITPGTTSEGAWTLIGATTRRL